MSHGILCLGFVSVKTLLFIRNVKQDPPVLRDAKSGRDSSSGTAGSWVRMGSPGCSLRLYVLILDCLCLAAFCMSRRPWAIPGWPPAVPAHAARVERELSRPSHNNPRMALIGCRQGLQYSVGQWVMCLPPWGDGGDL